MADNSITLIGNVTRDPELRYTQGGRTVAGFGLAVNRRFQVDGEWQETTSFFDVAVWGDLGENTAKTVEKGHRVIVIGRVEQRSWDTEGGERRSKHEVVADEIGPSLRWAQAKLTKVVHEKAAAESNDEPETPSEETF